MDKDLRAQMLQALLERADAVRYECRLGVLTLRWHPGGFTIGTASELADRIWSEWRGRSLPTAIDHVASAMPSHCYGVWSADLYGLAIVHGRSLPWAWGGARAWSPRAVAVTGDDVQYRLRWRPDRPVPFTVIVEPAQAQRWWPNQRWWARTGAATARLLAAVGAGGGR